ncbi:hypothetical protein Tco_1332959, partial [Tanacetum coccineum]
MGASYYGRPLYRDFVDIVKRTLELGTRGVEYGEEELRYRTTINPYVMITEEEGLLKFLHDRFDELRRKSARRRVLIREMEALGERGVGVDSLECLKQAHAKETAKLAGLTDVMAQTL